MPPEPLVYSTESIREPSSKKHSRLLWAVVICGAISTVISLYILLYNKPQQAPHILVGVDFGAGSGLYEFVTAAKTGKPSLIPYLLSTTDNKKLHVIDSVRTSSETYYLLQEDAATVNVYQRKEGGIVKITNTQNLKRNLSYDVTSHTLAYESSTHVSPSSVPWSIVLFSLKDNTESNTQNMSLKSQLVEGGAGLFVTSSSSVDYLPLSGGEKKPVVHAITPQKTLLSKDGTSVSVFDAISNTINTYKMKPSVGMTFIGASDRLSIDPLALAYLGTDMYVVFLDKSTPASVFQLENLRTHEKSPLFIPRNAVITSVTYE